MSIYLKGEVTLEERKACTVFQKSNFTGADVPVHLYRTTASGRVVPKLLYKNNFRNPKIASFETENDISFKLRPEQVPVFNEAKEMLGKDGSCLLNLSTGFGKCFDPKTKIMMADGDCLAISNIRKGDFVMNALGKPSRVLSLTSGISMMYTVLLESGVSYTVTGDHPICVITQTQDGKDYKLELDTPLRLRSSGEITGARANRKVMCYYNMLPLEYTPCTKPKMDPYLFGLNCGVNTRIPKEILHASIFDRRRCLAGISCNKKIKYFFSSVTHNLRLSLYKLSRSLGLSMVKRKRRFLFEESIVSDDIARIELTGMGEFYGFELEGKCKRFVLKSGIVAHNTCLSVYLASCLKVKPLVITSSITVQNQWKKALALNGVEGDVVGVTKAVNLLETDKTVFLDIGFCIVDELHLHTKSIYHVLGYIFPRYLLGLTATTERADALDKAYPLYFGNNIIKRFVVKEFKVYNVRTGFAPELKENIRTRKLDWNAVLKQLSESKERLELIVDWILKFRDDKVLVVCKRIEEAKSLLAMLKKEGTEESCFVDHLFGPKKEYRRECSVLIGTVNKLGVGFDDPTRNVLILTTSVKDVRQIEGRMRQTDFTVIDFVDEGGVFQGHWRKRKAWYLKRGGKIKTVINEKDETKDD